MSNAVLNIDGFRLIQTNVVRKPQSQTLKERAKKQSVSENTLNVILGVIKEYKVITKSALMSYTKMADSTIRKYIGELKHRGNITSVHDRYKCKTTITFVK